MRTIDCQKLRPSLLLWLLFKRMLLADSLLFSHYARKGESIFYGTIASFILVKNKKIKWFLFSKKIVVQVFILLLAIIVAYAYAVSASCADIASKS